MPSYNPAAGAVTLVWMIGAWLLVGGLFEVATAFTTPAGKGWLILVGLVDLALGAAVLLMDPREAFAFLGYYVGISFIFAGSGRSYSSVKFTTLATWSAKPSPGP